MAGSKRKNEVKQREFPDGKRIAQGGDPERYYSENPAWTFANADQEMCGGVPLKRKARGLLQNR